MYLLHLGLPVHDKQRSQEFYVAYFGFDPATALECEDGTLIISNSDGFDLALRQVARAGPLPGFLHFGFSLGGPDEVRAMMAQLESEDIERHGHSAPGRATPAVLAAASAGVAGWPRSQHLPR